ncbi:MAG: hypothetical protein IPI23_21265 [Bacteroidetes bacterium]|nr:hypothetical protein [Bacteroidota bacterium]
MYDWYSVTTNADGALSYTITVDNSNNVYAELFDGDGTTELNGNYTSQLRQLLQKMGLLLVPTILE